MNQKFLNKIILKDSIEYDGSANELKQIIREEGNLGFRVKWIDHSTFKFISNISLGTLLVNYLPVEGIKGIAKISELNNGKTIVELNTKIRIELYFFAVISIVLISVGLFSEEPWPIWTFAFFPIALLWFWWVYRLQEKGLFKRLKKYIAKN